MKTQQKNRKKTEEKKQTQSAEPRIKGRSFWGADETQQTLKRWTDVRYDARDSITLHTATPCFLPECRCHAAAHPENSSDGREQSWVFFQSLPDVVLHIKWDINETRESQGWRRHDDVRVYFRGEPSSCVQQQHFPPSKRSIDQACARSCWAFSTLIYSTIHGRSLGSHYTNGRVNIKTSGRLVPHGTTIARQLGAQNWTVQ